MPSLRLLLPALLLPLVACDACPPEPGPDAGPLESVGTLRKGGVEHPYRVVLEDSSLLIHVIRKNGGVCDALHSHVVEAESVAWSFLIDADDPSKSTLQAVVHAAGLNPDEPENRALFEDTADVPLGEGDRKAIKQSVLDEIAATDHPTLTFSFEGLSAYEGEGTLALRAAIAGEESEIEMSYKSTIEVVDGKDVILVEGEGVLKGAEHGMPRAQLSVLCVEPDMELRVRLKIAPGADDGAVDGGIVEPFEPTFFGDPDDCSDSVGFHDVRDALLIRCAGCHSDPPRAGATVPLVEWDHYWFDSARHPGVPLWQTARDYVFPPDGADDTLAMPPKDPGGGVIATDLSPEEKDRLRAWFDDGAKKARCQDDPPPTTFAPASPAACGTPSYEDVADFLVANCFYCHGPPPDGLPPISPAAPHFDDYALGVVEVDHPFYKPLTIWEASVERLLDDSMPPGGREHNGIDPLDVDLLRAWTEGGYPASPCDAPDAGSADAGASDGGPVDGGPLDGGSADGG